MEKEGIKNSEIVKRLKKVLGNIVINKKILLIDGSKSLRRGPSLAVVDKIQLLIETFKTAKKLSDKN